MLDLKGLKAVAWLAQTNVVIAGIIFLGSIVLARALGPQGRGELATLVLWPTILSQLALIGIHLELARRTAAAPQLTRHYRQLGKVSLAVSSLVAVAGYWLLLWLLARFARLPVDPWLAMLAALMIPFNMWNLFQAQIELGRQSVGTYNLPRGLYAVLNLLIAGSLWLSGAQAVVMYLLGFLVAIAGAAVVSTLLIRPRLPAAVEPPPDALRTIPEAASAARPYAIATLINAFNNSADRMLVSLFFPPHIMGIYVVAQYTAQAQDMFGEAIAQVFFARVAAKDRLREVDKSWLTRRLRQTLLVYVILAAGMLLVGPTLIRFVFGERFAGSSELLLMLIPIVTLKTATRPFEEVLKAGGKPMQQARTGLIATCVFVVLGGPAAWFGSLPLMLLALASTTAAGFYLLARAVSKAAGVGLAEILLPRPSDLIGLTRDVQEQLRNLRR